MSAIHDLKIGPLYFEAVSSGNKKAELRNNDRDFKCGDYLLLREWEGEYTGQKLLVVVTHILPVENLIPGAGSWVILSFRSIDENDTFKILSANFGGAV
ncbi:DUF3850 domain-containing protein [Pantoea sp. NGS-ED-1003]|uniref:DUF3850 domain-containing protein n=1 Tax=Pantoea sp. NGS-ED-1003 TaxID=1526743 RepID=UPI0005358453|nr:DUF3850 domain-containing protein [Pantoea sp. NGS-ED-1003]